jgi:hypothetical protein
MTARPRPTAEGWPGAGALFFEAAAVRMAFPEADVIIIREPDEFRRRVVYADGGYEVATTHLDPAAEGIICALSEN